MAIDRTTFFSRGAYPDDPAADNAYVGMGKLLDNLHSFADYVEGFVVNLQTGTSYTAVADDVGKIIVMTNSSANVVTIPSGILGSADAGKNIYVLQGGTGNTSIAGNGTILNKPFDLGFALRGQYTIACATKATGLNDYWLSGGLTPTFGLSTAYGNLYVRGNATATTINTINVWEQITVFTTASASKDVTVDPTEDHILINNTGDYQINLSVSFSGGANDTYEVLVKKNNGATDVDPLIITSKMGGSGDVVKSAANGIATLTAADTLEVWVRNTDTTANATFIDASLSVERLA